MSLAVMKADFIPILYAILRYGVYLKNLSVVWCNGYRIYTAKVRTEIEGVASQEKAYSAAIGRESGYRVQVPSETGREEAARNKNRHHC